MWFKKLGTYSGLFLLLRGSALFFVPQTVAYSIDEERMQQRLVRMHERYTGAGDHDQFLYKLQQAINKTTSKPAREALEQIIGRREEMRPAVVRGGVSSIPFTYGGQTTSTTDKVLAEKEQRDALIITGSQNKNERKIAPVSLGDERYQLNRGYIQVSVLQDTRLQRVNELRSSRGRQPLALHPLLHKTAAERSETMRHKGVADHKRFVHSAYYAYGELENRFSDKGVQFVNVSRVTFTENIGRSSFRCSEENCTQKAIDAMRQTFEFYLREEGTKNDAHWRTIINPLFQIVGLGITVDEFAGKFYLTTHYGTEVK